MTAGTVHHSCLIPGYQHLHDTIQYYFSSSSLSSCFSSNCCSVQSITTIYGRACTLEAQWQVQTDVESGCTDSHPSHVVPQKQTSPSDNHFKIKHRCLHQELLRITLNTSYWTTRIVSCQATIWYNTDTLDYFDLPLSRCHRPPLFSPRCPCLNK